MIILRLTQEAMMLTEQLIQELRKLTHAEKLRVVQLLVNEMAEAAAHPGSSVPRKTWSPYDTALEAETMMQMLTEVQ
jgi:hypothetical protein